MWGIDLGTTNTLLARWDGAADRPVLLELPAVARGPRREDALSAPSAVPTALHLIDEPGFWARLGRSGPLARRLFLGRLAHIGRPALELNAVRQRRSFVPTFKRALGRSPLMPLARAGGRDVTARECARIFLRELLAQVKKATGERIRDLVVTSPVEAFESYRAEVASAAKALGVRRVRFVDEPVAAALGYGLGLARARLALVVDIGGGTLHVALVRLEPKGVQAGRAEVLAKAGRDVGGDAVDRWLLEDLCRQLGFPLDDESEDLRLWHRLMQSDACRVKEALHFQERATFELAPPEDLRSLEVRLRGVPRSHEVSRAHLVRVLRERGFYAALEGALAQVLSQAAARGVREGDIDDVLMVGGSTLLPEVYPRFEARFGRARVRAWQPFEAVALGAAGFAAGKVEPADFIVHDYALLTYDLETKKPEHTVIVPRGTRFPTSLDLWKRSLVPTCALGEPERAFKLVVCEIGTAGGERRFTWDGNGQLHEVGAAERESPVVVKLNEANPALGTLDPPHSPQDPRPRLEVAFGVNGERWLCATVLDLMTKKHLMREEPVVRLL